MNNYTIPKPRLPLWARLLFGLVTSGLLGLGIVAFETFSLFHGWLVAAIFASVIEVGAATDAIGLANGISKKTWWIIPALIITLVVSGWYNYATVQRAGAALTPPVTDERVLAAVGIGPLASLFFMAIGVGIKINEWETAVKAWEVNRQSWIDAQAAQAEQSRQDALRREQEARDRQAEFDRQERERQAQLHAQLEYQKEKARIEAEERLKAAEIAAQERQSRREAKLKEQEIAVREAEAAAKQQEISQPDAETSVKLQKGTYEDFLKAAQSNGTHPWTAADIAQRFHVTQRTGFTWLARYKSEHPTPIPQEMN